MKSKLIFRFFFLLMVSQTAAAQQNIFPVLADTPRWCMVSMNYNGSAQNTEGALFNFSTFKEKK